MKNDIKNYLHLYLGCECLYEYIDGNTGGTDVMTEWHLNEVKIGSIKVKPILRKLKDMTDSEAGVFYRNYWGKDYAEDWSGDTGSAYFRPKKVNPTKEHALRIFDGLDYESGDFLTVIRMVPQLLRCGFDLFNLIENGMAIENTKTSHPVS